MREDISQSITKSFHSSKSLTARFAGISYTVFMTVKHICHPSLWKPYAGGSQEETNKRNMKIKGFKTMLIQISD